MFSGCCSLSYSGLLLRKEKSCVDRAGLFDFTDYIFYGNGFASGVNDYNKKCETEYNKAKSYAYLARIKKSD